MPKTLSGNNPRREQRLQELLRNRIEQKYLRRIGSEINRAMRKAAKNVQDSLPAPIDRVKAEHEQRLNRILTQLWTESGRTISEQIAGNKKAMQSFELKRDGVLPTEQADMVMQQWIATVGARKIVQISNTTINDVRRVVEKGIENGLSERDLAKEIRKVSPVLAGNRAQSIARTETGAASANAAQATAQASGVELEREWVASSGERTRKSHDDADGQVVPMDQPFIVGGYELMMPCDPKGPAHLTINCRCAVAYIVKQ